MQQVNLYTEAFRPRREVLSLAHVLYATLGFILILAALSYALTYWSGALQNDLDQSSVKLEAIRTQADALEARAALVKRDESLVRGNRLLREKITAREEMLGTLGTVAVRESTGFSPFLVGLARYSLKSLWLTRIAVSDSGSSMILEGKTAEAKLVPEYLGSLNSEEVFSGRSFEMFDLSADESRAGQLHFLLQSKALEPISVLVAKSRTAKVVERVSEEAENAR
jgi:hypothetical protein